MIKVLSFLHDVEPCVEIAFLQFCAVCRKPLACRTASIFSEVACLVDSVGRYLVLVHGVDMVRPFPSNSLSFYTMWRCIPMWWRCWPPCASNVGHRVPETFFTMCRNAAPAHSIIFLARRAAIPDAWFPCYYPIRNAFFLMGIACIKKKLGICTSNRFQKKYITPYSPQHRRFNLGGTAVRKSNKTLFFVTFLCVCLAVCHSACQ